MCFQVSPEQEGSTGKALLALLTGTQACLEAEGPPRLKRTVPTASENVPGILQGVLKALDLGPPRTAGRHPPPLTGAQDLGLQTYS